ncbi:uncharacterized protein [Rutidosis leptorrhynchoides]|uniref:uncharacterized protein n=1 Tax=Rutidosis leptorrhynchoides TaxID=125765 RepID=UPI003A999B62
MLDIFGVPCEKFRTVRLSINKLLEDNLSFEQIKNELIEEEGLDVGTVDQIGWFVSLSGSPRDVLSQIKERYSGDLKYNASLNKGLKQLDTIFEVIKFWGFDKVVLDLRLSLARCPDYYTGMIYEALLKSGTTKQVISIASGGRYDNLIGMFAPWDVDAVGVTFELEHVYGLLEYEADVYFNKVNAAKRKTQNNSVDRKGDGRKLSPDLSSSGVNDTLLNSPDQNYQKNRGHTDEASKEDAASVEALKSAISKFIDDVAIKVLYGKIERERREKEELKMQMERERREKEELMMNMVREMRDIEELTKQMENGRIKKKRLQKVTKELLEVLLSKKKVLITSLQSDLKMPSGGDYDVFSLDEK